MKASALAAVTVVTLGACVSLTDRESSTNEKDASAAGTAGDASAVVDGAFPGQDGAGGTMGDAGPVWKLYTKTLAQPTQWSAVPLSAAWSGPNAPPLFGIEAATQLSRFDRLIVFDNQGKVYVRSHQLWRTPRDVAQAFPAWTYEQVLSASHEQSSPTAASPTELVVLIGAVGRACLYEIVPVDDTFVYKACVDLGDGDGGFDPRRESLPVEWSVTIFDDAKHGLAEYLQEYMKYGDFVHLFDATLAFTNKWPAESAPFFAGTTNPPSPGGVKAGYFDTNTGIINLIGP